MINAIKLAIAQMTDPRFRSVLIRAVLMTFGVLVGLFVLVGWLASGIGPITIPWIGAVDPGGWATGLAVGAMMLASMFLMIPVASIFIGFFLDEIAGAVEDKHYPHLPSPHKMGFGATLLDSLKFLGLLIGANILALLIYLLIIPIAPLVFYAMNGFLLSREYFQLVALRRLSPQDARILRKQNGFKIWLLGIAMAVPLSIPLLNLLVPVIGVAAFTHLFHELRGRAAV